MIEVEVDARIERPIDDVFERLVDIPGYNLWMDKSGLLVESAQTSAGSAQVGTKFVDTIRHGRAAGEIVELDRPKSVKFRQTIRFFGIPVLESRPEYTLESHESGTELHHHAEGNAYGFFRLAERLFERIARAERRRTVASLKRSLEAERR
jgi:uncharacterized protein YndB with AHSA1/START domain